MADREMTLSVVVISWNQRQLLEQLVGQLLTQEFDQREYEVIVVDDGSTDGSREWLATQSSPNLRTLFGTSDRGRAASRNAGILAARGRIIVMIDGDHTVRPDFLQIHAERHAAERCAIVGKSNFADHPEYRALNHYLNCGGAVKLPPGARLPGRYFLTRNCSVPRDLLLAVGMFDERFKAWGGEDLDLGMKLEGTGIPIYGEPRALALHHHHRPLGDLLRQLFIYGREAIPVLLAKHPQLFVELNLDRVFPAHGTNARFGPGTRFLTRILMIEPFFRIARVAAHIMRRHRLPRVVFDYLHLRAYARGYGEYLRAHRT